jgi:hypothetical protein
VTRYVATLLLDDTDDRWGPQVIEEWVSNATHADEESWASSGVHALSLDVRSEVDEVRRAEQTILDALRRRGVAYGYAQVLGIADYIEEHDKDD